MTTVWSGVIVCGVLLLLRAPVWGCVFGGMTVMLLLTIIDILRAPP